jgi:hypothetical protein
MTEKIRNLAKKFKCSKYLPEVSLDEQALPSIPDMRAGPPRIQNGSSDDKADLDVKIVSRISEEVTTQVNTKFVETHKSISESFTELVDVIQKAPWAEQKSWKVDSVSLSHMVVETQKQYNSLSLELRQLRQRCNQDLCKTEDRFGNLEDALVAMHGQAISDLIRESTATMLESSTTSSTTTLQDAGEIYLFPRLEDIEFTAQPECSIGDRVRSLIALEHWKPRPLRYGEVGTIVSLKSGQYKIEFEGLRGLLKRENFQVLHPEVDISSTSFDVTLERACETAMNLVKDVEATLVDATGTARETTKKLHFHAARKAAPAGA